MPTVLKKLIKKESLRKLLVFGLGAAIILGCVLLLDGISIIMPPPVITNSDEMNAFAERGGKYFRLQVPYSMNTYYYTTTENGGREKIEDIIYFSDMEGALLTVAKPTSIKTADEVDALPEELENLSMLAKFADEEEYPGMMDTIRADLAELMEVSADDVDGILYPFMVDDGLSDYLWNLAGCLLLLAMGLFLLGMFIRSLLILAGALKHPVARELAAYGDVEYVGENVESQLENAQLFEGEGVRLTRDWLVITYPTLSVRKAEDLVWAWARTYRRGFAKNNYVEFRFADGESQTAAVGSSKNQTAVMEALATHIPSAFYGYSAENKQRWKNDRAGMVAQAHAQAAAGPIPQAAPPADGEEAL